jgi:hypothetical protein
LLVCLCSYYKLMLAMAKQGDPRAQKEYGAWLRKLDKAKKAYREAYDNEEIETLAAYGYEVRGRGGHYQLDECEGGLEALGSRFYCGLQGGVLDPVLDQADCTP